MSKSIATRINDGCLTPQNHQLDLKNKMTNTINDNKSSIQTSNVSNSNMVTKSIINNTTSQLDMLSPPLSPYQRHEISIENKSLIKSYLPTNKPFNLENYQNYDLKVNPWKNVNKTSYKSFQVRFLNKYSIIKKKESHDRYLKERSTIKKRKYNTNSFMDMHSDSNSNDDSSNKVRTRRIIRESNSELSDRIPSSSASSPKKRKTNIQQQQQSFIDENIPDYSPDASSLPNNAKCLKIDWKGQPMDLSDDPNVSKLHPAEVTLASILRLPCNVYLDSKRRLFHEKVNRFKAGMQFRRTDAQKACRIDVNKASRLFAAFEKVGWLNDEYFQKYL